MKQEIFDKLVKDIQKLHFPNAYISEKDIEQRVEKHLKSKGYNVIRQDVGTFGRTDLIVKFGIERVCIELKRYAVATVFSQLDKYAITNDGVILACWKASDTIRHIFKIAKESAKIPIALIEFRSCQPCW